LGPIGILAAICLLVWFFLGKVAFLECSLFAVVFGTAGYFGAGEFVAELLGELFG